VLFRRIGATRRTAYFRQAHRPAAKDELGRLRHVFLLLGPAQGGTCGKL
jgi:hypothetical protein